jgi:hypothetical protein
VQKTHTGPYFALVGTRLEYQVDTSGGNSGSPVIYEPTGEVIGVHGQAGCSSTAGNKGTGSNHTAWQAALADPKGVCFCVGLSFIYPNGLPEILNPAGGTTVEVYVEPSGGNEPQPDTGMLHYDDGSGFVAIPMRQTVSNQYIATFPELPCAETIRFYFSAEDTSGARHTDPASVANAYEALAAGAIVDYHSFDFETDPGWSTEAEWAFGQPTGGGSGQYGNFDPTSGHTGLNVYGYNLDGDYTNNMPEYHLTSTPLDCTGLQGARLRFWRWLSVGVAPFDHAYIRVSNDGTKWTTVWENPSELIDDRDWHEVDIDISALADGQPEVYLRWTMGTTNEWWAYCGWNIDDVRITGFVCAAYAKGDLNCDGAINGADIDPFFLALGDPPAYAAQFPDCEILLGDMNGDGATNGADIDPFFECLGGGNCP